MKRLITVFLCLLSIPWVFGAGTKIDDLYYILDSDAKTATVTYSTPSTPSYNNTDNYSELTSLSIPSTVEYDGINYSVTEIGDYAFYICPNITGSLTIPNSVTKIGDHAFSGCSGFTGTLTIPNSVISIGDWAFDGCRGFNGELILGQMVSWIGEGAFVGCSFTTIRCYSFSPWIPGDSSSYSSIKIFDESQFQKPLYIPFEYLRRHSFDKQKYFWNKFQNKINIDEEVPVILGSVSEPINFSWREGVEFWIDVTIGDISQFEWISSDPNIIKIEDGKFEQLDLGICNIIGKSNNGYFIGSFKLLGYSDIYSEGITVIQKVDSYTQSITFIDGYCKENIRAKVEVYANNSLYFFEKSGQINITRNDFEQGASSGAVEFYLEGESCELALYDPVWSNGYIINLTLDASEVTLNREELVLMEGQQCQLEASVKPANCPLSIDWRSSDSYRVSVDDQGLITAKNGGEATISAQCGSERAECIVKVLGSRDITLSPGDGTSEGDENSSVVDNTIGGGSLQGKNLTLRVGQTASIKANLPSELTEQPQLIWKLTGSNQDIVAMSVSDNTLEAFFTGQSIGKTGYDIYIGDRYITSGSINVIAENPLTSLELDPKEISLAQNAQPISIKPVYLPANASNAQFKWVSSNENVATVSESGEVTPLSQGEAIITATALDGSELSATCSITVTVPIDDSFEFDFDESVMGGKEGISLYIGDTYQFKPKAHDGYRLPDVINWSSSDSQIVSVNENGLITALQLGTATITASATVNGKEVKAECLVSVIEVPASSIELSLQDATLTVNSKITLTADVYPENAGGNIIWTSSNPEVATVSDQGEVYGVSVGTATVTAAIGSVSASCQINVVNRIPDIEPSVSTSDREIYTMTGHPVKMAVYAEGGEASGWSYVWTKNGDEISVSNELNITAHNDTESVITETYKVKVENEIDNVVILSEVFDFVVRIYPGIEENADGTGNGISFSTGNGDSRKTREGNTITLSASTPKGGNPEGWSYLWSDINGEIGDEQSVETVAAMSAGNSMAVEETPYYLEMTNYSPEGELWAEFKLESNLEVYRRPKTPLQMLRKGDGTSHTFVVMMPITDMDFERLAYRLVYGWTDSEGDKHVIEQTNLRYCHTDADVYENPTNRFWVYSVWNYQDGSVVSSGLRYLDGSADESFDASVFDGEGAGNIRDAKTRSAVYTVDGHYIGSDASQLEHGIYIITYVSDGVVKSEKIIVR